MCERGVEINFRSNNNPETTEGIKWFATKSEAEEFAKTLIEPIKEEDKQPLKQVVHCTTQEEWAFVLSKLPKSSFLSKQSDKFTKYNDHRRYKGGIAVNVNDYAYSDIEWYKNEGYQILTFQEWCNLNGYKMEKKVEFEVGKWYRVTDGTCKAIGKNIWYVKSPKLINGIIICEEHIHQRIYKGGDFGRLGQYTYTEVSIEEIQQYLPEKHPDKIKPGIKFKVGDWVVSVERSLSYNVNEICKVSKISKTHLACENKPQDECYMKPFDKFRHATPEEINNHLISIGQIPAGEPLNT